MKYPSLFTLLFISLAASPAARAATYECTLDSEALNSRVYATKAVVEDRDGKKLITLTLKDAAPLQAELLRDSASSGAEAYKLDDTAAEKSGFWVVFGIYRGQSFVNVSQYMSMEIPQSLPCLAIAK